MKKLFALVFLICVSLNAQKTKFKIHDNGLIYSQNSITKLKHIVDSVNLRFKNLKFNKTFFSDAQTKAHYIRFEDRADVLRAKRDMGNNISYSEFKAKYPNAIFEENVIVVKMHYTNLKNIKCIDFSSVVLGKSQADGVFRVIGVDSNENKFKGKWAFEFQEKTEYIKESLDAFYFVEEFKTKPIPAKYAKMIQYVDCLIDTNSTIYVGEKKVMKFGKDYELTDSAEKFIKYVDAKLNKPEKKYDENNLDSISKAKIRYEKLWEEARAKEIAEKYSRGVPMYFIKWNPRYVFRLDSLKRADPNFMVLLNKTYKYSKIKEGSNDEFEEYVGRYIGKEEELELKRNRRVIGECGMDSSPIIHALNIALLSAETIKWEIFLRSHLHIMNNRFDWISNYKQDDKDTYVKEIEVLDINVSDLILGISLCTSNSSKNHYYASFNIFGRSLAESSNAEVIGTNLLNMIADNNLDDYNRVLLYRLFDDYNFNLKDTDAKKRNRAKLKAAVATMPDYISSRIIIEN